MENFYLSWKKTLNELNDFNCKVEFLQSNIRENVITRKNLNIDMYLSDLLGLVNKHLENLNLIAKSKKYELSEYLPLELKVTRRYKELIDEAIVN